MNTSKDCLRLVAVAGAAMVLAACGDSTGSAPTPAALNLSVGGTVTGLTSGSIVLQDTNLASHTVVSGTPDFTFPANFSTGSGYSVVVTTQPTTGLECWPNTNYFGTIGTANVTNIGITCSPPNAWIWEGGSNSATSLNGTNGVYVGGSPAPGGRYAQASWKDASGNFWIFGGSGLGDAASGTGGGYLNDLWEYNAVTQTWTVMGGSTGLNAAGVYPASPGTAAATNFPGARAYAATWTDASGNFWLFGGTGYDSTTGGTAGELNDLWEYSPGTGMWTWVSGSNVVGAAGVYGTEGAVVSPPAATPTTPGARDSAVTWIDASGNLWLFGGQTGAAAFLNDLWVFTPGSTPSTGTWTWVDGSTGTNQNGAYGTQGTVPTAAFSAATGAPGTNVPGARVNAVSWTDGSGNFWLFGGYGLVASGATNGYLSDLWVYTPGAFTASSATWAPGTWTFVDGASTQNVAGTYGALGAAGLPGARGYGTSWLDVSGNFWMFGGYNGGEFNDMWSYVPGMFTAAAAPAPATWAAGTWTYVSGASTVDATPSYGTLGLGSATNVVGARDGASAFVDLQGNFWLFGGEGYDTTGFVDLSDLWEHAP